ncbi:MAG: hypothetical protein GWP44_05315 [Proteobacteria bacterium]|nr:hypothetical protein [Pseudomonadota bacterium]
MRRSVRNYSTFSIRPLGSLLTIFGIAELFLAAVGLYGVMSFSVNQRRQEMGVRMALIRGAKQLSIGMVLGIGLGCLLAGPLSVVTFGVETTDVTAYAMSVLTLGAAGMLATIIPAISATRTNPVEAMRPDLFAASAEPSPNA